MSKPGPYPLYPSPRLAPQPLMPWLVSLLVMSLAFVAVPSESRAEPSADVIGSVAGVARNLRLTDVPGEIDVRADSLDFRYNEGRLDYDGHVEVRHAGVVITADHVTVAFTPGEERNLKNITATGNVHVERGEESAYGGLAVYDTSDSTIVLSENARLGSGSNVLTGERVVVYLKEGRATVEGGPPSDPPANGEPDEKESGDQRVRVVIQPDELSGDLGSDLLDAGRRSKPKPTEPATNEAPGP